MCPAYVARSENCRQTRSPSKNRRRHREVALVSYPIFFSYVSSSGETQRRAPLQSRV